MYSKNNMILNITDALRFMKGCYSPMKNFLKKLLNMRYIIAAIGHIIHEKAQLNVRKLKLKYMQVTVGQYTDITVAAVGLIYCTSLLWSAV